MSQNKGLSLKRQGNHVDALSHDYIYQDLMSTAISMKGHSTPEHLRFNVLSD